MNFGFKYIEKCYQFAFGYDDNMNVPYYYPETLLPVGINPSTNKNAALVFLIQKLLESKSGYVQRAILHLDPAMKNWNLDHFANFIGKEEYSSDSDDDDRDLEEHTDVSLAQSILNSLGKFGRDNLEKRITTLAKKTKNHKLAPTSVENFNKKAERRQAYFPAIPNVQKAQREPKQLSPEDELKLINIALDPESSLRLRIESKNNKKIIKIQGHFNNEKIDRPLIYKYYLPLFRGISYLVDRWNGEARSVHRRLPLEKEFIHYSEAVISTVDTNFYQLSNYCHINLEQLHENAKALKRKLLEFKRSEPFIYQGDMLKEFGNLLDYLQYAFSNGIEPFLKHLDNFNKEFPNLFPNNRNPFVPFSHLPFHAVKYALGEKNPYKPFAINPLWDQDGRPRKPHIGKFYISIHELIDFLNFDEPNNVPLLGKTTGITVPAEIGAEYEVSFLSFTEKERLFKQRIIRFPSFHKSYKDHGDKYLSKYGLKEPLFDIFKQCILDSRTQQQATEVLKAWLCLFNAVKAMHEVQAEIEKRQGICLFRHPNGKFSQEYPSEKYESNKQASQKSKDAAKNHFQNSTAIFIDNTAYSKTRSLRSVDIKKSSPYITPIKKAISNKVFSPKSAEAPYVPVSSTIIYDREKEPYEGLSSLFSNICINPDKNLIVGDNSDNLIQERNLMAPKNKKPGF